MVVVVVVAVVVAVVVEKTKEKLCLQMAVVEKPLKTVFVDGCC